ncbi:MAG: ABC transporter permease, partial [Bacteroidia bacterium]
MKGIVWKITTIVIMIYVVIMGLLGGIPEREILYETIRNLYFHVPMWFTMVTMFLVSVVFSIRYLSSSNKLYDAWAVEFANVGILFGFLGLTTGM